MNISESYLPISLHIEAEIGEAFISLLSLAQNLCKNYSSEEIVVGGEDDWMVISGIDEITLDAFCSDLRKLETPKFQIGQPSINYRCVLPEARKHKYRHNFVSSSETGFIEVSVLIEPGNLTGNSTLNSKMLKHKLDPGIRSGLLMGFNSVSSPSYTPLFDFQATLLSIDYDIRDSRSGHFFTAGRETLLNAYSRREFQLVEPLAEAQIKAPSKHTQKVKADILSRRGRIEEIHQKSGTSTILAFVPISNMFGYENSLRAMTDGNGRLTKRFSHFSKVPVSFDFDPFPEPARAALKKPA